MDVRAYLHEVQAIEVDDASAKQYETMVGAMNAQVRGAAAGRLAFDDEPSHYLRVLRDERRRDG